MTAPPLISNEDRARFIDAILQHSPMPPAEWLTSLIESKPDELEVHTNGEYFRVLQGEKDGLFSIRSFGHGNKTRRALYIFWVTYPKPRPVEQAALL